MRIRVLLLLAYAVLLGGITLTMQKMSFQTTSRLATIESLVERGTFAIDGSPYETTGDKVYIDGRYYSHQPPLLALAGALVYYPLHRLGMRLGPDHAATYALVTFALNGLSTLAGMVFFFRTLQWTSLRQRLYVPITASLACGTLLLPFSATLNSHGFCAALMAIGLYCFLLSQESDAPHGAAFWSGMAFSLCAAADHAMLVFYALLGGCILLQPGRRGRMLWFVLPGILTLVPTCAYYYAIGHSIKPLAARAELFVYPGSFWTATGEFEQRLTGASWNPWPFAAIYGPLLLVGPHGFLIYNPTASLALYGLARSIWTKAKYWREAAAVLVGSAVVIAYYAFASVNYSGSTYSIRWFIPFLPLWWFFGTAAIEDWTSWKKRLVVGLCALSFFYALAGALNPWPDPYHGYLTPLTNVRDELRRYHAF